MNTQDGNAGILLPNVLVLLLVGWGIFKSTEPLESLRPPVKSRALARVGPVQPIEARSWEDPFEAVAGTNVADHAFWDKLVEPPMSGAAAPDWPPEVPADLVSFDEVAEHAPSIDGRGLLSIEQEFAFFLKGLGSYDPQFPRENRGLVLIVTLPGGGFAMAHEKRHRIRYSVVAGLANSGYAPLEDGRLGVSYYLPRFGPGFQATKPEMIVHEEFRAVSHLQEWRQKRYLRVMVIYLSEDYLKRPRPGNFAQLTGRLEGLGVDKAAARAVDSFEAIPAPASQAPAPPAADDEWGVLGAWAQRGMQWIEEGVDTISRYIDPDAASSVGQYAAGREASRESSPLGSLAALVHRLRSAHHRTHREIDLQIVGPTNSDLLVKIIGEGLLAEYLDRKNSETDAPRRSSGVLDLDVRPMESAAERDKGRRRDDHDHGVRPPRILTAMATISDRQLELLAGNYVEEQIKVSGATKARSRERRAFRDEAVAAAYEGLRGTDPSHFRFLCGLQVQRIAPHDGLLTRALVRELRNRDIDPRDGKDAILLVTEFETKYARAIVQSFRTAALDPDGTRNLGGWDAAGKLHRIDVPHEEIIQQVSYLRGLDGQRGQDRSTRAPPGGSSEPENAAWKLSSGLTEQTTGYSQFDYLQRLVKRAHRLEGEGEGRRFKAIGILGSDIFDKLVVLRALRSEFPEAIFFTTDLDAVYLTEAHQEWAHNLVVATGFGLTLHPQIQNTIPPFRDSYQAATYLATLDALGYFVVDRHLAAAPATYLDHLNHDDPDAVHRPRVPGRPPSTTARLIEIGRTGPHLLSHFTAAGAFVTPGNWELSNRARLTMPATILIGILLVGCAALTIVPVYRYRSSQKRLADAKNEGPHRVLLPEEVTSKRILGILIVSWAALPLLWLVIQWANRHPREEPFGLANGVSVWSAALIQLLTIILAIFCVWKAWKDLQVNREEIDARFNEVLADDKADLPPPRKSRPLWLLRAYEFLLCSERLAASQRSLHAFWRVYRNRSKQSERVARTVFSGLLLVFIVFLLAWWEFGGSLLPVRGPVSRWYFMGIQSAAFIMAHFLLFYAVDAALLSWAFLRGLRVFIERDEYPFPLEESPEEAAANPRKVRMVVVDEERYGRWETLLVLIGSERGRQVNHVLIFPFIIYFLLYVSRHETFDYFPIAYTVTIPTVVAFAMLVVVSMLLRSSGKHLFGLVEERIRKANAISHPERYEREAGDPAKADDLGKDKTANLRKIREEALKADVKRLERAKRNMEFKAYNSPILKGALIPLGGTGILVLMELLANLFK